jgi:hypothetical protein
MLSFYANAHKILAVLVFVCLNVECADPYNIDYNIPRKAIQTTVQVESYKWSRILNQNLIISSTDRKHIATIFILRFGAIAGKYGAYFNTADREIGYWPFDSEEAAKKWIVCMAGNMRVKLATYK